MRIGSLFSGYGGLDMAAMQVFPGDQVAWHCEYDDAPAKILAHHYPDVPNYRDVTAIDWATMHPVDIITGGYPCQPFSAAGKRKGTDDERHLWPCVREAIRHLRPRYTLLENVAGHRTLGFDRVLGDLAEDGLHVRWASLRASDVGAPHHRERLFILVSAPDTERCGRERGWPVQFGGTSVHTARDRALPSHPDRERLEELRQSESLGSEVARGLGSVGALPDPEDDGRERSGPARDGRARSSDGNRRDIQWGPYGPAVERWERLTRPAPVPTELNRNCRPRLNAAFAEWMMGLPAGWVTDPDIGLSRADQLKAIGNGVCPQQAALAYMHVLALDPNGTGR